MLIFEAKDRLYRGNLHLHTSVSDGSKSPDEAAELYRAAGYDFIAVTDHRRRSPEGRRGSLLLLPGIELDWTLPDQAVHLLGIGADETVTARSARARNLRELLRSILDAGGLAFLAHPAWSLNTPDVLASLEGLCGAEVFNSVSQAPWNGDRADATVLLDTAAAGGLLLNTIAADDSHFYEGEELTGWIWLRAEALKEDRVLRALRQGDYFASQGPMFHRVVRDGGRITVDCSPVRRVLFLSNLVYSAGRCVQGEGLTRAEYSLLPGERFVRIVLVDDRGRRAWLNPIAAG